MEYDDWLEYMREISPRPMPSREETYEEWKVRSDAFCERFCETYGLPFVD